MYCIKRMCMMINSLDFIVNILVAVEKAFIPPLMFPLRRGKRLLHETTYLSAEFGFLPAKLSTVLLE